ncbi:MAG: RNA chaperone Hfq [Oscillospiraceae bacterium]|nr:RNA chaperone Hfq [Oscillospiraceae bacterium]
MQKQDNNSIQEQFLTALETDRRPVTVFLMNGYQLKGYVAGHDTFSVILMTDGKQQMIFKHAISTFTPEQPVEL